MSHAGNKNTCEATHEKTKQNKTKTKIKRTNKGERKVKLNENSMILHFKFEL